jgi:hypothetical protein
LELRHRAVARATHWKRACWRPSAGHRQVTTRRNTGTHFIQPSEERIIREVGYGLSFEGATAYLVKSMDTNVEPVAEKGKVT